MSVLYLFGSVDSILKSKQAVFDALNLLPFYSYINIGFESADDTTLEGIGKPITSSKVKAAFNKMVAINAACERIEITGNFIIGDKLSPGHDDSLASLLETADAASKLKGSIYLSPLKDRSGKRELLPRFYEVKQTSRLPVFIYLIQRL